MFFNMNDDGMVEEGYIVVDDSCIACGACEGTCPTGAITLGDYKAEWDSKKCIACGACVAACPLAAISEN